MSLLSPGMYLRSKLLKQQYDIRAEQNGNRIMTISANEASFFISAGHVIGKLDAGGNLQYLISNLSAIRLRGMLEKAGQDSKQSAEDNRTSVLDGKTYRFHMRRVAAWAR